MPAFPFTPKVRQSWNACRTNPAERKPYRSGRTPVIDPETMPLIAELTEKGHRIGVADDINFEFGLNCILEHARQLIADRREAV